MGLFVHKILSKNSILTSIKGHNSVANKPKFEPIQAFMHALDTCKNEEDPVENKGARAFTRFLDVLDTCKNEEDQIKNKGARALTRFLDVLDTCKNEEDPLKNKGARAFTRFLPL